MTWKNSLTAEELSLWDSLSVQINAITDRLRRRQRKIYRYLLMRAAKIDFDDNQKASFHDSLALGDARKRLRRQRHALMQTAHDRWNSRKPEAQ